MIQNEARLKTVNPATEAILNEYDIMTKDEIKASHLDLYFVQVTCYGQFNDEDLAKNQYFDESQLEQLQNLFGGLCQ